MLYVEPSGNYLISVLVVGVGLHQRDDNVFLRGRPVRAGLPVPHLLEHVGEQALAFDLFAGLLRFLRFGVAFHLLRGGERRCDS